MISPTLSLPAFALFPKTEVAGPLGDLADRR